MGINEKFRTNIFLSILLLLSLLKLVLVSGNEIIAEPDDALSYLYLSTKYWTGSKFPDRPAAYPTWIALVHITGIPLRIGAELLLLFSSGVFAAALRKIGVSRAVAAAVFAAVAFHPYSISLLDRTMSDNFYAPVLIIAISLAILALHAAYENLNRVALFSAFSGFCFAVLWNTREEYILLLAILVQIVLSAAILFYLRKVRGKALLRPMLVTVLPLLLTATAVNISLNTYNYVKYSYWGQATTQPEWLNSVLKALTRIKPTHPIRYAAITKEALQMAYRVSPTLARMQSYFDLQENEYVGVRGEIGTAGFIFYLRRAVESLSDGSLADERKVCADIEKEIYAAIEKGKIPSRPVWINPRVDPAFSVWLPYLPESFFNMCKLFVNQYDPVPDDHPVMPPGQAEDFNKIANRRINLILKGPMRGWVYIPGREIKRIELRATENVYYHWYKGILPVLSSTCDLNPRPDIANREGWNKALEQVYGFTLPALPGRYALNELRLIALTEDGTQIPVIPLRIGTPFDFGIPGSNQQGQGCVEDFSLHITGFQRRLLHFQAIGARLYAKGISVSSMLAGPLALLALGLHIRKIFTFKVIWIVLLANLILAILTGTLFYSIIDACAWPIVVQPRYLFSQMLLYSSFIVILFGCTVQSALAKIAPKKNKARDTTHD